MFPVDIMSRVIDLVRTIGEMKLTANFDINMKKKASPGGQQNRLKKVPPGGKTSDICSTCITVKCEQNVYGMLVLAPNHVIHKVYKRTGANT